MFSCERFDGFRSSLVFQDTNEYQHSTGTRRLTTVNRMLTQAVIGVWSSFSGHQSVTGICSCILVAPAWGPLTSNGKTV
jgi:hypothetical protein